MAWHVDHVRLATGESDEARGDESCVGTRIELT